MFFSDRIGGLSATVQTSKSVSNLRKRHEVDPLRAFGLQTADTFVICNGLICIALYSIY